MGARTLDQDTADAQTASAVEEALMSKRVEDLEDLVGELKADRDKFLRWGVIVLGGAVVSLVTWVFNLLAPHK
jgi:hypothetical protein